MDRTKDNSRERLLDRAEELFAQKGYDSVSVREITTAAGCNLAAVNYYFGGKQRLYMDVFRERWAPRTRRVRECFEEEIGKQDNPALDQVIGALAHAFLAGPMTESDRRNHFQLMQREMANPTEATTMVVREVMRPFHGGLSDRIRPHLPAGIDEEKFSLSVFSIIGTILYFNFARPALSHMLGHEYDDEFLPRLIQHIAAFGAGGINVLVKEKKGRSKKRE